MGIDDGGSAQILMTLRDYFAAKAMQSLTSLSIYESTPCEDIARYAYEQADAMIAQRNKEK